MTSFARFHNLALNLYDVIGDVTDQLKIFLKQKIVQGYQNTRSQASQSNLMKKINKKFKFQLNMPFKMLLPWQHQTP